MKKFIYSSRRVKNLVIDITDKKSLRELVKIGIKIHWQ